MNEAQRAVLEGLVGTAVLSYKALSGGDTAQAWLVHLADGERCVCKTHQRQRNSTLIEEARGLAELRRAGVLRVPQVWDVTPACLVMEYIAPGQAGEDFDRALAEGLASLHEHQAVAFGFHTHNFIGRTPQHNPWTTDWPTFLWSSRLEPMWRLVQQDGHANATLDRVMLGISKTLADLFPTAPSPSLLHGDLWRGNVLVDEEGMPCLIDPAVYYGDAEAEFGIATLFGGFSASMFSHYEALHPPQAGYKQRRLIYQLYHLLNHVHLFGAVYLPELHAVLRSLSL